MMIVKLVSKDQKKLEEIAELLLAKRLWTHVSMNQPIVNFKRNDDGVLQTDPNYRLQGISQTLLFNEINNVLRARYQDEMPLLYSEPLILMDPLQRDHVMETLAKV